MFENKATPQNTDKKEIKKSGIDTIKELKLKLMALASCLKDERNKNSEYIKKINELEGEIERSAGDLDNLNKEKYEMQSELSKIKSIKSDDTDNIKGVVNKLFNKDKINFDKFDEVAEAIEAFKYENKILSQKYVESKESFDQQKIKFDTILQVEEQKSLELQQKVEKCKKDIEEFHKQKEIKNNLEKDFNEFIEKHKKDCDELNKLYKQMSEELKVVNNEINEKQASIQAQDNTIHDLNAQITEQTKKIEAIKEMLKPKKLGMKVFKAEDIEGMFLNSDERKNIKFYSDNSNVIIEIGGRPFKIGDTKISLVKNSNKKVQIEINGEKIKPVAVLDELIIDYFIVVYDEYYEESKESNEEI